jgi:hypothetical protein
MSGEVFCSGVEDCKFVYIRTWTPVGFTRIGLKRVFGHWIGLFFLGLVLVFLRNGLFSLKVRLCFADTNM